MDNPPAFLIGETMTRTRTETFGILSLTVPSPAVATPLSSVPIYTPEFELHCPSGNSGDIFIGDETVDSTWLPRIADSNTNFITSPVPGDPHHFDLNKIHYIGTAGDTIIVQYRKVT